MNQIQITPELKAKILSIYFQNLDKPFKKIAKLCQCDRSVLDKVVQDYIKNTAPLEFITVDSKMNLPDFIL